MRDSDDSRKEPLYHVPTTDEQNAWMRMAIGREGTVSVLYNPGYQWTFTCRRELCSSDEYKAAIASFHNFLADCMADCMAGEAEFPTVSTLKTNSEDEISTGDPGWWFRGQARLDWAVQPGVHRSHFVQSIYCNHIGKAPSDGNHMFRQLAFEKRLTSDFIREASGMVGRLMTNENWYILAQHHGLPTRLLDWSLSPHIALWMAMDNLQDADKDGVLIAMPPKPKKEKANTVDFWTPKKILRLFDFLTTEPRGLCIEPKLKEMCAHEAVSDILTEQLHRQTSPTAFTLYPPYPCSPGFNQGLQCRGQRFFQVQIIHH